MAKEICERLKLYYDTTNLFLGQDYPTANIFFIKVCEIKVTLYDWFLGSNEVISMMTSGMIAKFDKYWSGCSIVMAIVIILDLRYKMKLLKFYFPITYGPEAPNEVRKIREKCYDLLFDYQSKSENSADKSFQGASSGSSLANLKYDK